MRIFGVTPRFWPTAISAVMVATTVALGVWQVQRLFWKQGVIDARQTKSQAAPLTTLPAAFDPAAHGFRRAQVSGEFQHGKELYVGARSLNGNLGFHVQIVGRQYFESLNVGVPSDVIAGDVVP